MADRMQFRRDTAANWTAYNPILLEGELGFELDTDQYKLGDGVHNWNNLPYRGLPCVQQRGDSVTTPMSQKAVGEAIDVRTGYFVCDTAAATAAKTVSAPGFVLTNGGALKIKMANANTANNATLNINSIGAKALIYDGARASAANSWEAEETLDVYYDATNEQFVANNAAGGGKFLTGEKVKEVGITNDITFNNPYLSKSGGVYDMNIVTLLNISTFINFNSTQQKNYLILRDNSGKFGTSSTRKHRCYPVNAGEKYIISNTSQNSTLSVLWAFVTTSDAVSGGDIPFVSGTGLGEVPLGKSIVITIPNGCTHVICSYGEESTGFAYGLFYKVDVKEWSKFASGEEVRETSIATEISSGNNGLAKSGDVYNALLNKVDIKIGKNLLDATKCVSKYIDENGDLQSSSIYYTSSYYIPVLPETAYYASANNDTDIFDGRVHYIAFYDENKSLISTLENTKSFTTPVGCYYIKLCWYYVKTKLMLNQGSERGTYEEYSIIGGYPDKNEERIANLESTVAEHTTELNDLNGDILVIDNRTKDYEETTEITNFTTMTYNLDTGDNLGKFGTSRLRAVIPVVLGDVYKLQNTSTNDNIRYALVTTDAGGAGETVPVVSGTSVLSTGSKKDVTIEITQELIDAGCQYLIFNTGTGFASHLYKYEVTTFRGRVDENTANIATNTEAIAAGKSRAN